MRAKRRNYPSDALPVLLLDMIECSFTKSLEKAAAEGMGRLTQTMIAHVCVRLSMPSAAYVIQSKIGRE